PAVAAHAGGRAAGQPAGPVRHLLFRHRGARAVNRGQRCRPARVLARIALGLAVAATPPIAGAELRATPLRGDARLVEFAYDQDNTYLVLARPKAVTHVQFAA